MYDFAHCLSDYIEGITHSICTLEFENNRELYDWVLEAVGLPEPRPRQHEFARLNLNYTVMSKRKLLCLVENNLVEGWDDPRLPTLAGLKRRGLLPEAVKEFVLSFGLSKTESEPDWEALLSTNRKLLDAQAPHYFFVAEPVELKVNGLEKHQAELKLHPKKDLGKRKVKVSNILYISKADSNIKEGETFRLKDLCNVRLTKKGKTLEGDLVEGMADKKIQWVSDTKEECEVLVPKDLLKDGQYDEQSLETVKGYCDCVDVKPDTIIQFERFGFCRLDKTNPLVFIFSC